MVKTGVRSPQIAQGVKAVGRGCLLLPAAITALALAGCTSDDGRRTTQTRDVLEFTRVDTRDSVDVRLHVGKRRRVHVLAGDKVIEDVQTDVRDGTLHLAFDHDEFGDSRVVVEVSVPEMTGIRAPGRATSTPRPSTPAPSTSARTALPTSRCMAPRSGSPSSWAVRATRTFPAWRPAERMCPWPVQAI